jgi:glycosyltransferase involved in cell wall biosynthesis
MTNELLPRKTRILTIFGNVAYYGQERCNIALLDMLQKTGKVECLMAVNDRGVHWFLQPHLDAAGLECKKMRFCWNIRKPLNLRKCWSYFSDIIKGNIEFRHLYQQYKPDYIHCANEFHFMTLFPSLLLSRSPVVFHLGDKPYTKYLPLRLLWKYFVVKKVTHFVVISEFIRQKLYKIQNVSKKTTLIRNNPTDRLHSVDNSLPAREEDVFTIVYMGQISSDKGVDLLIEAALKFVQKHRKSRLFIAGTLEHNNLAEMLIDRVKQNDETHRIIFLGMVENISELLNISNIHICPSVYEEPLSSVVGEAKEAHRPSIVFASGGIPELIQHKIDGYICPEKTSDAIVAALEYYHSLPDWGREQGESAYVSMERLGITRRQFLDAWETVYGLNN